jgi:hypothetical protein
LERLYQTTRSVTSNMAIIWNNHLLAPLVAWNGRLRVLHCRGARGPAYQQQFAHEISGAPPSQDTLYVCITHKNTSMDFSCRVHLRNNGDMPYVTMGSCPYCSMGMLSLVVGHLFRKPQSLRLSHHAVLSGRGCLFNDAVGICTLYRRMVWDDG